MAKQQHTDEESQLSGHEKWRLDQHLRHLGLSSIDDYRAWCREHGFAVKLLKRNHQRRRELEYVRDQKAQHVLERHRQARRNPAAMLDEIFAGNVEPEELSTEHRFVHMLLGTLGRRPESRAAFRELLERVQVRTKLFDASSVFNAYPRDLHNTMLGALASIATHRGAWLRPLDDWVVDSKSAGRQFRSLTRHLFAKYPIPAFFDSVWFRRSRTQNWFLHVGAGGNIRKAERLFTPLTKRMAHALMQAPADYIFEHAYRWGQIHGLGGNRRMVEAVRGTRLGSSFAHDDFWITVLRFFVANPLLDTVHYGPIIDYLQHQRFETHEVLVRPGVLEEQPPPQPGLSMQRRTADTLLRQVDAWHVRLGKERAIRKHAWPSSGIPGFELAEGREGASNRKVWRIRELLTSDELFLEGRAMCHCVGSYSDSCAAGRTSIWSLQCETKGGIERMLTIEVRHATRLVSEARGKFNKLPAEKPMNILRRWAAEANLGVPGYVAG